MRSIYAPLFEISYGVLSLRPPTLSNSPDRNTTVHTTLAPRPPLVPSTTLRGGSSAAALSLLWRPFDDDDAASAVASRLACLFSPAATAGLWV